MLDPHAVQLAEKLDGLPLALATAGAYLYQVSTSLQDYLAHYNNSWMKLQKTSPRLESYQDALYSTWNISYEHICSQNESAGKLLQLWGYFDNQDLWYELLAKGGGFGPEWFSSMVRDELSFNESMRLLCDHALVHSHAPSRGNSSHVAASGYSMHGCVHAWIMYALNSKRDISMAELACLCVGYAVPDKFASQYWVSQQRLLPHASKFLELIYDGSLLISDKYHTLSAASRLGRLYHDQKKFKEAEDIFTLTLRRYETTKGVEHPSTLRAIHRLGRLYSGMNKLNEAEEIYLRVLSSYEKILGIDNEFTLDVVHNLGLLYRKQNKFETAEKMYMRALKGSEEILGAEHYRTLQTMINLGDLYQDQNEMEKAEEMLLRAMAICEKTLTSEHTLTIDAMRHLGSLYFPQNKMTEAEDFFLRALKGCEEIFGTDHKQTLGANFNLALVYKRKHRIQDAKELLELVVEGYTKALGPDHWETIEASELLNSWRNESKKESQK